MCGCSTWWGNRTLFCDIGVNNCLILRLLKQKMRTLAKANQKGTLYKGDTIYKESMNKLVTKEYSFTYNNLYNFTSINNILYLQYLDSSIKVKLSNQEITSIVHTSKDNVYYLINDTLYRYNLKYGETKIMKYQTIKMVRILLQYIVEYFV